MKFTSVALLTIVLLFSFFTVSCKREQLLEKKDLVLAVNVTNYSAPVYIALAKNFWKEEGLNVTKKGFAAGRFNLEAVLGGGADFGTVAESPMVFAGLTGQKALIAGTIATGDNDNKIIARRDHGISSPQDLKNKKIGTTVSTAAEYFLYLFLKKNGMKMSDVKLINLKPAELPSAVINGDVDAIAAWEPFVINSERTLGEEAITFADKGLYDQTFHIVITEDFAQKNPNTVKAILRGLIKAEKFLTTNRKEALDIVSKEVGLDTETLDKLFKEMKFSVKLDQSVIKLMNEEAQWAIEVGHAKKGAKVPDFRSMFYIKALKEISPAIVTIQ